MTRAETRWHLPFIGGLVVAIAAGAMLVMWGDEYAVGVGLTLVMWIALVQSWAAFSGLSGYISLGHAVFYGVGAYVMVAGWQILPIWLAVIAAGVAAGAIALLLGWPSLRVRGPYFVILTFGLAEFVKYIVVSIEAALGRTGRLLIGTPSLRELFVGMLSLAVLSTTTLYVLRRSRLGTGLIAIREDEIAAEAVGVNTARTKLVVFGLSAVIPGMVGALMSLRFTYFEPMQSFSPVTSFTIVTIAVLGGSDDVPGPLLGAAFLVALSELLWARAPELYMIILGVLLVGFVLFAPEGIYGKLRSWGRGGAR
jgi:branched-chain amino acid transport system permease protein